MVDYACFKTGDLFGGTATPVFNHRNRHSLPDECGEKIVMRSYTCIGLWVSVVIGLLVALSSVAQTAETKVGFACTGQDGAPIGSGNGRIHIIPSLSAHSVKNGGILSIQAVVRAGDGVAKVEAHIERNPGPISESGQSGSKMISDLQGQHFLDSLLGLPVATLEMKGAPMNLGGVNAGATMGMWQAEWEASGLDEGYYRVAITVTDRTGHSFTDRSLVFSDPIAGNNVVGSTTYPNGGITRRGAVNFLSGGSNYVVVLVDSDNGYAYLGANTVPSVVTKVSLGSGLNPPELLGSVQLNTGEDDLQCGVIDTSNGYAYFATGTTPGIIVKVALGVGDGPPRRVGALTLSESYTPTAVIDTAAGYAYFGTDTSPAEVVKVTLGAGDALPTRLGKLTLASGENKTCSAVADPVQGYAYYCCRSGYLVKVALGAGDALPTWVGHGALSNLGGDAVIDAANGYAYIGTWATPARVLKVALGAGSDPPMEIGAVTLNTGENNLGCAAIDPASGYGYFGASTSPGKVVKVALGTGSNLPVETGSVTLNTGENTPRGAAIDAVNGYAYFGANTSPGIVVKVAVGTASDPPTRVAAAPLITESLVKSGVIDAENGYAYFGTNTSPGMVVKVAIGDDSTPPARMGAAMLNPGENYPTCAVIDAANGFGYFGTNTNPGRVVKVALGSGSNPPTRVDAVTLDTGEGLLRIAVIDPVGGYAYFGTNTMPGRVVKVDVNPARTFQRVGGIILDPETYLCAGVIDAANGYAYFGASTSVVKVALGAGSNPPVRVGAATLSGTPHSAIIDTASGYAYFGMSTAVIDKVNPGSGSNLPTRVGSLTLDSGEVDLASAAIDAGNGCAYFGTNTSPARIVKVMLGSGSNLPTRGGALTLNSGENYLTSAVINPANAMLYVGTCTTPGNIVNVALSQKGLLKATRFTMLEDGTTDSVSFYSHAASGNVRLSLYSSDATPQLLWQSGAVANAAANDWLAVPIANGTPASLSLIAGTYWLGWQVDTMSAVPSYTAGTSGDGFCFPIGFDNTPATLTAPTSCDERWSEFISYSAGHDNPTATLSSPSPDPVAGLIVVNVLLSAASTDFTVDDIAPSNATVTNFSGTGDTYSFTLTPIAYSRFSCVVNAGAFHDLVGYINVAASNILQRDVSPTVALATTASDPVNSRTGAIPVTITLSQPVTDMLTSAISTTNATGDGLSSTDTTHWSFALTPLAEGVFSCSIPANVLHDTAGNGNTPSTGNVTRTWNKTPLAAFSANAVSGWAPFAVQFTDLSDTGLAPITAWVWNFGDGQTSPEQNPLHTYSYGGKFTVSLTVSSSAGSDSAIKTDYIHVTVQSDVVTYVDGANVSGVQDGQSWATAYPTIQQGLDTGGQVWVREGAYSPVVNLSGNNQVFGGFAGVETALTQRNWNIHPTKISGSGTLCVSISGTSLLDGFVISAGNPGVSVSGSPTIRNCQISDNIKYGATGGDATCWALVISGSPHVENCLFINNGAYGGHGVDRSCGEQGGPGGNAWGGAVYLQSGGGDFVNCIFTDNFAIPGGGGCGGDWFHGGLGWICIPGFYGPPGHAEGGAFRLESASSLSIANCTITGNSHGFYNYGTIQILNSIVLDAISGTGVTIATYSDIEGGHTGEGTIDSNPLFVDSTDFHLQDGSPCIDTGTNSGAPAADFEGTPRPQDGVVDMGAYEYTPLFVSSGTPSVLSGFAGGPFTPGSMAFTLRNRGASPVDWTAAVMQSWIDVSPSSGSLNAGDSIVVQALVNGGTNALPAGTYTNTLLVADTARGEIYPRAIKLNVKPNVVYVAAANTAGAHDGLSWNTAFTTIREAIDIVPAGSEIWVAGGMYTAVAGPVITLKPGVVLYGGFAGTETERNQRDWNAHAAIIDGQDTMQCVIGANNAVLDGFMVTRGNAAGTYYGGGMCNNGVSPTVAHCAFAYNRANYGGGIYIAAGAAPTITSCTFTGNSGMGGGIYDASSSGAVRITNCTFSSNSGYSGGAIFNDSCAPTIANCLFIGNSCTHSGAGVFNNQASPIIVNCTFTLNTAAGGAVILNANAPTSAPVITNCIVWGNTGGRIWDDYYSRSTIAYCDVQGGAGAGNINVDPLFVNAAAGNVQLQNGSPCIDTGTAAGAPASDIEGRARPVDIPGLGADGTGTEYDMGAYEAHFPIVLSVEPSEFGLTNAASVDFTLTFSKAVTGVAPTDFVVDANGPAGASVTSVTPVSDTVFTVTVATGSGDGTLGLNLVDDDSIVDTDGTPLGGQNPGNGNFTGTWMYSIEKTPPTGTVTINGGATYCNSTSVNLALTYDDGSGFGVTQMEFSNDNATWSGWKPVAASNTWALSSGDGTKTVYAQFEDTAGNTSAVTISDDITLDMAAPTGTVAINGGATYANSTSVTLALSAIDTTSGVADMQFSNDNATWSDWETYATSNTWTLTTGDGAKTVYAQYRDGAGNVSVATIGDDITLDMMPPAASITLDDPTPTGLDAVHFSVDFNESVGTSFDASDVMIAGTLSGSKTVSGAYPNYTVAVTLANPDANGTVGILVGTGVSDLAGNAYEGGSSPIYTIANWPGFTTEPQDVKIYTYDGHIFEVAIDGGGTVSYQWKWNDTAKAVHDGPITPTWALTGLTAANRGVYWCEVTYNGIMHESSHATLEVADPLAISADPAGGTVNEGQPFAFHVLTTGGFPVLSYHWWKDGSAAPGAPNAPDYVIASATSSHAGHYSVVVKDAKGDTQPSNEVELTVIDQALPIAGGVALLALASVIAGVGMTVFRRR